jgi:hypothetical protein
MGQDFKQFLQPMHSVESTFIVKPEILLNAPNIAPSGQKYLHQTLPIIKTPINTVKRVITWIQTPTGMGLRFRMNILGNAANKLPDGQYLQNTVSPVT